MNATGVGHRLCSNLLEAMNAGPLSLTEYIPYGHRGAIDLHPPVFVVGPPRSGTTVLTQLLIQALNVAYLANRHSRLYGSPALVEWLRPTRAPQGNDFTSDFGKTKGSDGPWEGAGWWYRFFPRTSHYVDPSLRNQIHTKRLRRSVGAWTSAADTSVLFKNTYASLRLVALAEAFPSAAYIHVVRDEIDNCHSILEGRIKVTGSFDEWWGLQPEGWASVKDLDPVTQVLFQVRETHAAIARDLAFSAIEPSRVLTVSYEDVCEDTHRALKTIQEFAAALGVEARDYTHLPRQLQRRSGIRIHGELYARLVEAAS